jgi:predicted  nucleic acid-binding Zn-ribbon protein
MAAMMQIKTRLEAENTQLKQENDRLKDEVAHLARMLRGAVGEMTLEQLQLSQLERLIQGLINTSQGTLERFIEGLPPADVTDSIRTGLTV